MRIHYGPVSLSLDEHAHEKITKAVRELIHARQSLADLLASGMALADVVKQGVAGLRKHPVR